MLLTLTPTLTLTLTLTLTYPGAVRDAHWSQDQGPPVDTTQPRRARYPLAGMQ